jgi:hypothetical protein
MAREAPDTAWGMIDRHGRRAFRGLVEVELDSAGEHRPRRPLVRVERDPFSDLGQWLAKVLVAQRLPRTLLAAPRRKLTRARHLAQAARVSEPTTAAWVKLLRGRGFVDDASHELRLVRVREYFERWRSAVSAKPRRVFAARFSLPAGSADEQLHRALAGYPFQVLHRDEPSADGPAPSLRWTDVPRACLGLFEASAALGGIFVKNAPLHLYLETVDDETLRRFGLELAANERTQVRVIEPPWPETVFRGAVPAQTRSGRVVPSCDLLQVWLDVADHPVRGREQADAIERDVLAPKLFDET